MLLAMDGVLITLSRVTTWYQLVAVWGRIWRYGLYEGSMSRGLGIEASKTSHLGCVLFFLFVVPDVREH